MPFIENIEIINEVKYGFEKMDGYIYNYYLYGKMDRNKLDLNGFFLEDFSGCDTLYGKFVKIEIYYLRVEFLDFPYFPRWWQAQLK